MAEKFVATAAGGGSNGNLGTFGSPYLTIPYAKTQISSGDTISVRGGSYGPTVLSNLVSGISNSLRTKIRAYNGEHVIINNSGNVAFLRNDTPSRYITLEGLDVNGGHALLQLSAFNQGDHHHISVLDCIARNMVPGIPVEASGAADCEILNSIFHDCGADGFEHGVYLSRNCQRWLIKFNTIYNISGYGLHLYDDTTPPEDCKLRSNFIYRCGKAGIIAYSSGHLIANNICHLNGTNGILLRAVSGVLVDTNTCWRNGQDEDLVFGDGDRGIVLESGDAEAKGNIVWEDGDILGFGGGLGAGNIIGIDPLFANALGGDFSVLPGSPALNATPNLSADGYTDDFYGSTRP